MRTARPSIDSISLDQNRQKQQKSIKSRTTQEVVEVQKPRWCSYAGFVVFGLVLSVVAVNMVIAVSLSGAVFPGVNVAGRNIGLKTRQQALQNLHEADKPRKISLTIGTKKVVTTSDALGASRDLRSTVALAYSIGRETPWPLFGILTSARKNSLGYSYRVNSSKLSKFTSEIIAQIGKPPVNAQVTLVDGEFVAQPDVDGVTMDENKLGITLEHALSRDSDQDVSLTPSKVVAPVVLRQAQSAVITAKDLVTKKITLHYQDKTFQPSPAVIATWLTFPVIVGSDGKKTLDVAVDNAKVNGYIQTIANQADVPAINKKVTVKNGVSSTDQEGQDGTAIDQTQVATAIIKTLTNKSALDFSISSHQVAFKTEYNRITTLDGVARYIEINLSTQHLWVYQDNQVIYESPITSGAPAYGFATVTGLFSIYAKATNVWLDGHAYGEAYNYRVLVDYWMPFYAGYGLHDAWRWRTTFGGPDYYYNGSHGCVNLPLETAAFIYNWAEIGTPVWVHQ